MHHTIMVVTRKGRGVVFMVIRDMTKSYSGFVIQKEFSGLRFKITIHAQVEGRNL